MMNRWKGSKRQNDPDDDPVQNARFELDSAFHLLMKADQSYFFACEEFPGLKDEALSKEISAVIDKISEKFDMLPDSEDEPSS